MRILLAAVLLLPVPVPATGFSLESAGTRPVLRYTRVAFGHRRVLRAFVRTTLPAKNRTVRR